MARTERSPATAKTCELAALAVRGYNQYFDSHRAIGLAVDEDFIAIATRMARYDY